MTRFLRPAILAACVALVGGGLLGVSASSAVAAPARCTPKSLSQAINQADVVFRGMVDTAKPVRGKGEARTRTYTVTADRVYQGSLVADRVRVTSEVGAKCPPPDLAKGKRYIFFVTEQGSRLVSTSATARASHQLTTQVEKKLGSGKAPRKAQPPTAEFTKVANAAPPSLSRLLAPGAALLVLSLLGLLVVGRLGRRTT